MSRSTIKSAPSISETVTISLKRLAHTLSSSSADKCYSFRQTVRRHQCVMRFSHRTVFHISSCSSSRFNQAQDGYVDTGKSSWRSVTL